MVSKPRSLLLQRTQRVGKLSLFVGAGIVSVVMSAVFMRFERRGGVQHVLQADAYRAAGVWLKVSRVGGFIVRCFPPASLVSPLARQDC